MKITDVNMAPLMKKWKVTKSLVWGGYQDHTRTKELYCGTFDTLKKARLRVKKLKSKLAKRVPYPFLHDRIMIEVAPDPFEPNRVVDQWWGYSRKRSC